MENSYQNDKLWIRDLESLGWAQQSATIWRSPEGHLYRGPFKAWCLATGKGWPPNGEKE